MRAIDVDFALPTTMTLAYSLALTDHYFALETLREIGSAIPRHGTPRLPLEQEEQMLAAIRDPRLQRILGLGDTGTTATKKGSTFLKRLFGRRARDG